MSDLPYKYFWVLHDSLPEAVINDYKEGIASYKKLEGSNFAQKSNLLLEGVSVSPSIFVTPNIVKLFDEKKIPNIFYEEVSLAVEHIETRVGGSLGSDKEPMLLTVTNEFGGTIRNIGVTEKNIPALIHHYGKEQAYKLYIDFLESYSNLVLKSEYTDFKKTFSLEKDRDSHDDGLGGIDEEKFSRLVSEYIAIISNKIEKSFPTKPEFQLINSIFAVARSCRVSKGDEVFIEVEQNPRAYQGSHGGVVYSRNPFTGESKIDGSYKNYDGSIKGVISPDDASESSLKTKQFDLYERLEADLPKIEKAFKMPVEVSFVCDEKNNLYYTQFNKAEMTSRAIAKSIIGLNNERIVSDEAAIERISPKDIEALLHPCLSQKSKSKLKKIDSKGVTASPGTATGMVFFTMDKAIAYHQKDPKKNNVILVADELLVSDTPGLGMISGLVTKSSGMASHAAVMARSNGIPCVIGLQNMYVDPKGKFAEIGSATLEEDTEITLEAADVGSLYLGRGEVEKATFETGVVKDISLLVGRVLKNKNSPIQVRVNINNHKDAQAGLHFGAEGVGLCRTENMLTQQESVREIRKIIFSQNPEKVTPSFKRLEEIQLLDFEDIFRVMTGKFVQIRLMDMPLHELVPNDNNEYKELAKEIDMDVETLKSVSEAFHESNPMLGLRACRFGLITPEIYNMQIRAIVKAAYHVKKEGKDPRPGIMFPLVLTANELKVLRERFVNLEEQIRMELKIPFQEKIKFKIGTMVELPSAALSTDQLATVSEFFAFGTNDLTQTTLGISRNDSENYLPFYVENNILDSDPFKVLAEPVKELIKVAVQRGRRVRKSAHFGICGEQGGDIKTLKFCMQANLDYVSCSAYRVLPTRLQLAKLLL